MAQVEKYTLQQAKAIIAHVERTGATHSNENIDPARTKDNFSLWPPRDPDKLILDTDTPGQSSGRYAFARLKKRLSEVSCLQRDDVNVLCDWCLHLGVDVPPGYQSKRDFYTAAVRVMAHQYGPENVVYAWVHEDESGSHLHFGFVPVVKKELKLRSNASQKTKEEYEAAVAAGKTVIERVDAHAVINMRHLKSWHGWMAKNLKNLLGYDPAIYTGITKTLGGNISVPDLKRTGKNWRKNRNAAVEKFHDARRAAAAGKKAGLDSQIYMADPNREKPQAQPGETGKGQSKLNDLIKGAQDRGGRSGW